LGLSLLGVVSCPKSRPGNAPGRAPRVTRPHGQESISPGIYYLKGGGFFVSERASVTDLGKGVLLYNAASKLVDIISLTGLGSLSLSPMKSGPYQGITIFQDRNSAAGISILGNDRTSITGTIYAAQAVLGITATGGVDRKGNPLDQIGSLLLVADLSITGRGSFCLDATS
jgi:hypothetical protein